MRRGREGVKRVRGSATEGKISRPLIWVRSLSAVGCHFLLAHPIVFRLISRIVEDDVLLLEGSI